ncbi:hypothetical protein B296_00058828 [Ensete ventricosum]|uniref:Uncharacterized protein n=1 Tax=Ensete ventricosum TaxID=4639 RepID=A0A426XCK0_ENSVE|nr:hypothetical protein B296_00058828 [Ensete ventricosum]
MDHNISGVLKMDSVCVGTVTWRRHCNVEDLHSFAVVEFEVASRAVLDPDACDCHVVAPSGKWHEEDYLIDVRVGIRPPDATSAIYHSTASDGDFLQLREFKPLQRARTPCTGACRSNDRSIQLQRSSSAKFSESHSWHICLYSSRSL